MKESRSLQDLQEALEASERRSEVLQARLDAALGRMGGPSEESRAGQTRDAIYRISEAALSVKDLPALYQSLHDILRTLLPAENCFIALHDPKSDTLHWPYWVDQVDAVPPPRRSGRGLTEYVIRTGQPLLGDETKLAQLAAAGEIEYIGTEALAWMGVPLRNAHRVFGALIIQSHTGGYPYQAEDLGILSYVSTQIAWAIDRKASDERLQFISAAVEGALDSMFWVNEDGRFEFVNGAACRSLGYTREECLAMSVQDLDPSVTPEVWKAVWEDVRQGKSTLRETTQRRKDGSFRPVELTRTLVRFEGRELLFASARDITVRKQAEAALLGSEEKFSRAFQASPDAININRLDGTYVDVNEAFTRMSGWAPEEALGRTTVDLNLWVDLEDRARMQHLIQAEGRFAGLEAPFRMKDGSIRTGLVSGSLITVDGETRLLTVTRDITEYKRMEEALRQTQKLESLGLLAGGIAHDFNNLLTVVLGNLNLAQMKLPENAAAQHYLANMEATVLRATELTKQMLAYSGRGHFQVKPQDLNQVVREVTHLLEVSISKKVRLHLDLEPSLPSIHADAAQIQQVIMNLVTNASDAIGDREGVIHLSTAVAWLDASDLQPVFQEDPLPPGRYALLEVADTGTGMPPEVLARIFDPFFTTKTSGRGLGLSAMLGILRGHRAGLRIHSVVGQGSSFRVCFPASQESPAPQAPGPETGAGQRLKGRVLLVDDEDLILQTTGTALEALGLEVVKAQDGLQALDWFREADPRPDLVLMDLTMPRMGGQEAFEAMQDLDPTVPVVLSSGYTVQGSMKTPSGVEPAGFLQKPYQIQELHRLLQRVLGN